MTKQKYSDKPDLPTLATTLQNMQAHATMHGVSTIAIPKIGCGLDQMNWQDVVHLPRIIFAYSETQFETKCGVETSTSEQSAATHERQMEKLLTQLREADIIHEMGNDDEM